MWRNKTYRYLKRYEQQILAKFYKDLLPWFNSLSPFMHEISLVTHVVWPSIQTTWLSRNQYKVRSCHSTCYKVPSLLVLVGDPSLFLAQCKRDINSSPLRQNGRHFPDDIFKCIFMNENFCILIQILLKFVPKGPINHILVLIQIMAWHQ